MSARQQQSAAEMAQKKMLNTKLLMPRRTLEAKKHASKMGHIVKKLMPFKSSKKYLENQFENLLYKIFTTGAV
jgi:hypothetical protein